MFTWDGISVALGQIAGNPEVNRAIGAKEQQKKDLIVIGIAGAVIVGVILLLRKGK